MRQTKPTKGVRLITPRITALITTLDKRGGVNAAPYSWVYPVSFDPPLVGIGVGGKHKHTYLNAKDKGEFVVNIVSEDFGQKAVFCEERHKPGVNRIEKFGLGIEDSEKVDVPRIKESRAILECKVKDIIEIKDSDHLILIGEIVAAQSAGGIDDIKPLMHDGGSKFRLVGREIGLERKKA